MFINYFELGTKQNSHSDDSLGLFEKSSNQWIGGFFVGMEPHHAAPH